MASDIESVLSAMEMMTKAPTDTGPEGDALPTEGDTADVDLKALVDTLTPEQKAELMMILQEVEKPMAPETEVLEHLGE